MKYLKKYENFDFKEEDFDFEEEQPNSLYKKDIVKIGEFFYIKTDNNHLYNNYEFGNRINTKIISDYTKIPNIMVYDEENLYPNLSNDGLHSKPWKVLPNNEFQNFQLYENFDWNDEDFDIEEEPENDFTKFLKNEQIYDTFIENFKRNSSLQDYIQNTKRHKLFTNAFTWSETPQKHDYWSKLSKKWINSDKKY